jgi:hypothetical protein
MRRAHLFAGDRVATLSEVAEKGVQRRGYGFEHGDEKQQADVEDCDRRARVSRRRERDVQSIGPAQRGTDLACDR